MKPLLLIASLILGQGPYAGPASTPTGDVPGVEYVTFSAAGDEMVMTRTFSKQVCEMQTREIEEKDKDGNLQKRQITVVVCKPVFERAQMTANTGKMKGFDGTGAKLDAAELKRRVAKGGSALIAFNDQHVDANWFTVLKPETLVLVLASDAITPPPPPPAPAPAAPKTSPVSVEANPGFVMQFEKPNVVRMFPNIGGASIDQNGILHLQTSRQSWTSKTIKVPVSSEGKTSYKDVSLRDSFIHFHRRELPIDVVGSVTAASKKVEVADLKAALAKPRVVVVSTDGQGPDPAHAQLLKDDAIFLVPPPVQPSFGGNIPPMSAPVAVPQPVVPQPVVPQPVVPQPPKRVES